MARAIWNDTIPAATGELGGGLLRGRAAPLASRVLARRAGLVLETAAGPYAAGSIVPLDHRWPDDLRARQLHKQSH